MFELLDGVGIRGSLFRRRLRDRGGSGAGPVLGRPDLLSRGVSARIRFLTRGERVLPAAGPVLFRTLGDVGRVLTLARGSERPCASA